MGEILLFHYSSSLSSATAAAICLQESGKWLDDGLLSIMSTVERLQAFRNKLKKIDTSRSTRCEAVLRCNSSLVFIEMTDRLAVVVEL